MITVLIIDDQALVRNGIRSLLEDVQGIKVLGEAANGKEGIEIARKERPQVVLLDIRMPDINGLNVTQQLLNFDKEFKIIVVSAYECNAVPMRLIEAGACGYMTKGATKEEMIQAIRNVSRGQIYMSPIVATQLATQHVTKNRSPFDELSGRELQITIMVAEGSKVIDISKKLRMSPKTVNSYRYRIFEKLRIDSDVKLIHLAHQYGLFYPKESKSASI